MYLAFIILTMYWKYGPYSSNLTQPLKNVNGIILKV